MKWEKVEKQSDPAAVKTDDLTGEIGVFIAEMIDQVSYLLGTPQAACGDFIHQGNQFLLFQPLIHLCVNGSAGYGVTWMPLGASSFARAFVRALMPPLVAE
mgnify:CR=1 FL=1